MTPDKILRQGLPLDQAFETYARARKLRVDRPPLASVIASSNAHHESAEVEVRRGLDFIRDTIHQHAELTENRWTRFREHLSSGRLIAAGYASPRSADDPPIALPHEIWRSAQIDLSLSSVGIEGRNYEGVRVLRGDAKERGKSGVRPRSIRVARSRSSNF